MAKKTTTDTVMGLVKVHFLVDYTLGETTYHCNDFAEIPATVAQEICDNSSVEYAAD